MSEIISFFSSPSFLAASVFFVLLQWGPYLVSRWREKDKPVVVEVEEGPLDLSDLTTRGRLQVFLQKYQITGDAEIRNGFVYAPVPPERLEPLAHVLGRATDLIARMPNTAQDALYVMPNGNAMLTGIDLSDIREAESVMRRVAEDRKKSRSIYKGLTEDEITAFVRAGLSQWYKDQGMFEASNLVMTGGDSSEDLIDRLRQIVDLMFKVKGARND